MSTASIKPAMTAQWSGFMPSFAINHPPLAAPSTRPVYVAEVFSAIDALANSGARVMARPRCALGTSRPTQAAGWECRSQNY